MKIVCGKCSAECELPRDGSVEIKCPSCGAVFRMPSLADGETLPHPDTFPGYRLIAIVGHGGMGTVFRATQLSMDREVAIKVLRKKYAHVPRFVERFERESSALAALNHPNIVAVIDRGQVEDTYFFVMEYVHGSTLRRLIRANRLGIERAVEIAIEVCRALQAAHGAGVVHRDIKPGNVLVPEEGPVKVADFGIVRVLDEEAGEGERRARLGTAKYMAPEQKVIGGAVDPRADVYALGVTLFEMLTGHLPKGRRARDLNPLVPQELDEVCERATRETPAERFDSADLMREALQETLEHLRRKAEAEPEAQPPRLEVPRCPACGQAVEPETLACTHCGAAVGERCYRPGCSAINPIGAERCRECNGHVELLKRRRRLELEGMIQRAHALAEDGDAAGALRDLRTVIEEPHQAFADLREQAQEAAEPLAHRRRRLRLSTAVRTAAALLVIALAGAASYWAVSRVVRRAVVKESNEESGPAPKPHPEPQPQPPQPRPRPRAPRTDPLRDYLVELTGKSWNNTSPAVRLVLAGRAAHCLTNSNGRGEHARDLGQALDELDAGALRPPERRQLLVWVNRSVTALNQLLAADLRRRADLKPEVNAALQRWAAEQEAAKELFAYLHASAAALVDLAGLAATRLHEAPDRTGRLLLLDAAAHRAVRRDGMGDVASQVRRAGELLIRHLRRRPQELAAPELLDDACRRLERARRERTEGSQLAFALEAVVEALAARTVGP
jgi:serine/threonine protein kinase